MTDRKKGTKLYTAVDDYVIFDLETTGFSPKNDKIIEISALRVRNNQITDTFSTLINPNRHIPSKVTLVNNITDEMVADAPEIDDVLDDFLRFIGDDILVGHNIGNFDLKMIDIIAVDLYNTTITNNYIDTYWLAKRCLPELSNHRLETLSEYLGLETKEMHRAEYDCRLTFELYNALKPQCSPDIAPAHYEQKPASKAKYNSAKANKKTINTNAFLGKTCIVYGAFQQLSVEQIQAIFKDIGAVYVDFFCYSADFLILGNEMHKKFLIGTSDETIDSALKNKTRIISEYDFVRYADISFSSERDAADFDTLVDVNGKTVCLTGEFEIDTRDRVINRLVELGATVKKDIIKSLDYLVIGADGSANYKSEAKGTKIIKAEDFNQKGANINIIAENDFLERMEVPVNV